MQIPQYTLADYENEYADRHLLHGAVAKWAAERPQHTAIIEFETGREVSYREFDETSTLWALRLLQLGYESGDFLATMLPLTVEHVLLEYACFKIGVIHAPLDLRLKPDEVIRSLGLVEPKGFVTLGRTPMADFSPIAEAVSASCDYVEHLVQFTAPASLVVGALPASHLIDVSADIRENAEARQQYEERTAGVQPTDGAQVIYTTGSTGFPKPALLSHRNITSQNLCLAGGFDLFGTKRMLVNLPPSHVGCQGEALMSTFFTGGTAVIMHVFDAENTLRAIERHRVDGFGQIPAMFQMQWLLPGFEDYDLSSLRSSLFGGQQVSRPFVERLKQMTPLIGTGLGLTEMAGFVTYTGLTDQVDNLISGVGWSMPITPLSIRQPMQADGTAGDELPDGQTGEICFSGPQVFIDYVSNPDAYRQTVTSDGICYTGDLGYVSDEGLMFSGRSKLVIKPKGYQVHPAQIEQHFTALTDDVASCAAVGQPHDVFSEAVVLFVAPKQGRDVSREQLEEHARGIAAYMRPTHYVLLEADSMPLNRVAKTDYVLLKQQATAEIERLRSLGQWDVSK